MTIFAPPFTKKSPAARLKMRLPPALTLVVGAARPESATRLVSIIPVSHEGVSLTRVKSVRVFTKAGVGAYADDV